jgi:predicted GNAT family N-acyltransferase
MIDFKANEQYEIVPIDKITTSDFLKQYHYLSKSGFSFRSGCNYGLFHDDDLVGVAVFHTISAWETVKGCFGWTKEQQKDCGVYELGRLAMAEEGYEKNLTSWFLARALKLFRKTNKVRAVLSYADSAFHVGYIYQSLNFGYYGLTAPKKDYWIINSDGSEKKLNRGKPSAYHGEWRERSRKHRYLLIYDKNLVPLWEKQKYPKGDNTRPMNDFRKAVEDYVG